MKYPQIRIVDSGLLSDAASVYIHKARDTSGKELMSAESLRKVALRYRAAWEPYDRKIVEGLCSILGLEFRKNIVDVYVAPWFKAFSTPLVVGVHFDDEWFVRILAHELVHVLLTDNTTTDFYADYITLRKVSYGEDLDTKVLSHIEVHAVLEKLFRDIMGRPEWVEADKEKCAVWPDYAKAWDYVEQNGYETVLQKVKENYTKLAGAADEKA